MNEIHISAVPPEEVFKVWQDVEPLLAKAVARSSGRYETNDLLDEIFEGHSQLWIAFRVNGSTTILAACTTKFILYPRKKYLGIVFCGGEEMAEWQAKMLDTIEAFACDNECEAVEIVGRDGWVQSLKPYGYAKGQSSLILEKELVVNG